MLLILCFYFAYGLGCLSNGMSISVISPLTFLFHDVEGNKTCLLISLRGAMCFVQENNNCS